MIKIIKTDIGNRSILLEVANLTEDQMFEVDNFLCKGDSDSYDCGPYVMVCCGEFVTFDEMLELVQDLQKKYVGADIYVKSHNINSSADGKTVNTTTYMSEVEVPLCEAAQGYFYYRPTAKFSACVWTEPANGGTRFKMDSVDDYGWISRSGKFLEPEEMKQIMLGYLEQLPETGASEENWKAYFCDKLGYDFDTLC